MVVTVTDGSRSRPRLTATWCHLSDRVRELRKRGMTLSDSARNHRDYDADSVRPVWTNARFIDAIFRTLPPERKCMRQWFWLPYSCSPRSRLRKGRGGPPGRRPQAASARRC